MVWHLTCQFFDINFIHAIFAMRNGTYHFCHIIIHYHYFPYAFHHNSLLSLLVISSSKSNVPRETTTNKTHHRSDWVGFCGQIRHPIHHRAGGKFQTHNPIQCPWVGLDWLANWVGWTNHMLLVVVKSNSKSKT